ncbi:MAG: PLP-dependent aminotransferase family protein [Opitutaceae bacterium]|nr:PLP-dependent aminotransferase family protein [Opitutaceae bacterium]
MSIRLSELGLRQKPSDITRLMAIAIERPDMLSLAAGFTDNDSLPLEEVRDIVNDISKAGPSGKSTLQYGSNIGRSELRSILTKRLEAADTIESGGLDEARMFVSNGSQQSLYLAIQTLCDPGDCILVEQPTYFVFLEILDGLGVTPIAMPMNEAGEVDVEGLEALLKSMDKAGTLNRLKALYLVSYFANPTGHSISESTKSAIGSVLSQLDQTIAVIEDAAYRELYYETPHSARSCLSVDTFTGMPILYTSTLTKPYASGLKVGYAYCTDESWMAAMLSVKGQQDFGTANFAQAIVERALSSGSFDRHVTELRAIYKQKMETLHGALESKLSELGWAWPVPGGALYLWLRSPNEMRTDGDSDFHAACIENGVFYVPGDLCYPSNRIQDRIRLSFGALKPHDIEEAASRFSLAAKSMTRAVSG